MLVNSRFPTTEGHTLLLECVVGSQAYGLATPASDIDVRGVFALNRNSFLGLEYLPQLNFDNNNSSYYELGRFVELLLKNNPTVLELLASTPALTLIRHPLLAQLTPERFLSRLCEQSFAGYARAQLKKAKGLNKKLHWQMDERRRSLLEFCHILHGAGSIPATEWLKDRDIPAEQCGLAAIDHLPGVHALFYVPGNPHQFKGIANPDGNDVLLSSIPKGLAPLGYLHVNKDGYSMHCKAYREYWDWVQHRNDDRYRTNQTAGADYDTKNMMHLFRLLDLAQEIAENGTLTLQVADREEMFRIRNGRYTYDELLNRAEVQLSKISHAFAISPLPAEPDSQWANDWLVQAREQIYGLNA